MSDFAPITLRVIDENGNELFSQSVPYEWEIDVKQVMERAFVLSQTPRMPDPIVYTLQYYGYSEQDQYPGYLGYELESIDTSSGTKPSNQQYYWQLLINGVSSQGGADSEQPRPGSTVTWKYTPIAQSRDALGQRSKIILSRRLARRDRGI